MTSHQTPKINYHHVYTTYITYALAAALFYVTFSTWPDYVCLCYPNCHKSAQPVNTALKAANVIMRIAAHLLQSPLD